MRLAIQREDKAGLVCVLWFVVTIILYIAGLLYLVHSFVTQNNFTHGDALVVAGMYRVHRRKLQPKIKQIFGTK
jgi:uncharacterized membrane protein